MPELKKAFKENGRLKNLKRFAQSPLTYMADTVDAYGSMTDLHLPMGNFVIVNDADEIGEVFLKEKEFYRKSSGYKEIARVLGNGLLTAEGEEWAEQRRTLQPSFHKTELRKLLPAIWDTGISYLTNLDQNVSELRLDTEMSGLTLTILLNSLIKYQSDDMVDRMGSHITFGQDFIVNRIRKPFKWPVWVPTSENRQYHQMMREANELIQQCVDDRKSLDEQHVHDILSVLLTAYDPVKEFDVVRNQILTFLVAGHETSAVAMTWTLHALAHHQEIQERLYQEVKDIDALSDIDLMNFKGLEYTQKVIKESLRYYPPIWNIVRRSIKSHKIGDHIIPANKQLMLNIYLLHHNPKYWDKPEVFDPERFDKTNTIAKHKFQYLPFGGGARFCIGNNFALYEIMILIIQFVKKHHVTPITEKHPAFNPLLTLRPAEAVEVKIESRRVA